MPKSPTVYEVRSAQDVAEWLRHHSGRRYVIRRAKEVDGPAYGSSETTLLVYNNVAVIEGEILHYVKPLAYLSFAYGSCTMIGH